MDSVSIERGLQLTARQPLQHGVAGTQRQQFLRVVVLILILILLRVVASCAAALQMPLCKRLLNRVISPLLPRAPHLLLHPVPSSNTRRATHLVQHFHLHQVIPHERRQHRRALRVHHHAALHQALVPILPFKQVLLRDHPINLIPAQLHAAHSHASLIHSRARRFLRVKLKLNSRNLREPALQPRVHAHAVLHRREEVCARHVDHNRLVHHWQQPHQVRHAEHALLEHAICAQRARIDERDVGGRLDSVPQNVHQQVADVGFLRSHGNKPCVQVDLTFAEHFVHLCAHEIPKLAHSRRHRSVHRNLASNIMPLRLHHSHLVRFARVVHKLHVQLRHLLKIGSTFAHIHASSFRISVLVV
mmetsp:Transcript_5600/g.11796  ORF Transcript_5600/g.11796 Transcript_5600/m.11796 type:complete len:360 (+) Transcript_5600:207-1286(+)